MGILQARILDGLPCPPSGDLPDPGIKPRSPALQADALTSEPPGKPLLRFLIIITYHDEVFPDFREMKIIMLKYFKISVLNGNRNSLSSNIQIFIPIST